MRERLEVILAVFCPIKQDGSIPERLKDFEAKVVFSLFHEVLKKIWEVMFLKDYNTR